MKFGWNFQCGGEILEKKSLLGEYIFWNYTIHSTSIDFKILFLSSFPVVLSVFAPERFLFQELNLI